MSSKIKLRIEGGNKLRGTIRIDSAKNAVLPLLAATVLVNDVVRLQDIPKLIDIDNMLHILASLGVRIKWDGSDLIIDSRYMTSDDATAVEARSIRGSIFLLGSVLGRFRRARLIYPGGCAIGNRPIDLHIQGLRDLGVTVQERKGFITCNSRRVRGGDVHLDFPSVGATENLMMASVLGKSCVRIINAAKEPEVIDLANFLNKCGARVSGAGTSVVTIEGVKSLSGCTYTPIPDRIVTGSYLLAVASVGGDVTLTNAVPSHNQSLITKIIKSGCKVNYTDNSIHIQSTGRPKSISSIQTSPYPGFPTDLQSQISVFQALSRGVSTVTENLFESRFKYVPELIKMGAKITVRERTAIITGVDKMEGAHVIASDLRGGVALVIAGLAADGITEIENAEFIYRGHQAIEDDLSKVGANIIKLIE